MFIILYVENIQRLDNFRRYLHSSLLKLSIQSVSRAGTLIACMWVEVTLKKEVITKIIKSVKDVEVSKINKWQLVKKLKKERNVEHNNEWMLV